MQRKKGISLIVLIITIIVMIILASAVIVTLNSVGILDNADKAVEIHNEAELKSLVSTNLLLNGWYAGKNVTADEFEEYLNKTGNDVTVAKIAVDVWTVSKNDSYITIYQSGDIYEGKVDVWDGSSIDVPELKNGNWYIYNCAELNFLQAVVNGTLTDAQKAQVTNAGYDINDYVVDSTTTVYLMENLDLGARQTNGTLTTGTHWIPIGSSSKWFLSDFEGNGHTIRGAYIQSTGNFIGLFGGTKGTISNLTVAESYFEGTKYVGGITAAGLGPITNCNNINTRVIGTTGYAGGIVGQLQANMTKCSNSGHITVGDNRGGGLIGLTSNDEYMIRDCINTGDITYSGTSEDQILGGIIGRASTKTSIYNCINRGTVTGTNEIIGGIAGYFGGSSTNSGTGTMSGCINFGDVFGAASTGGLIGASMGGTVEKSYNAGIITAKGDLGGIIGTTQGLMNIQYNFNIGTLIFEPVSTSNGVGGITGWLHSNATGSLNNNYNIGKITLKSTSSNVGGIVGGGMSNSTLAFSNNYYKEGILDVTGNSEGTSISSETMKTQAFVDMLNTGLTTPVWEIRAGENDGYPVIVK